MTQHPAQAPLVAEALQWVDQTLEAWIADCEADPSGFALWAAQRFRSCRTQILGLARQLEQAHRQVEAWKRKDNSFLQARAERDEARGQLEQATQALHRCSIHSGADVSDGPRQKPEYVVDDVCDLRDRYNEALDEIEQAEREKERLQKLELDVAMFFLERPWLVTDYATLSEQYEPKTTKPSGEVGEEA